MYGSSSSISCQSKSIPILGDAQAEEYLRKLEPLVQGLQVATDCTWTPKQVAGQLMTLVKFMEQGLGRKVISLQLLGFWLD